MLRNSGPTGLEPVTWLSQLLKEFDMGSKERTARALKILVQCVRLSVVCDQLNDAKLHCLEEFDWGVCVTLPTLT